MQVNSRSSRLSQIVVMLQCIAPYFAHAAEDNVGIWAIVSTTDSFQTSDGDSRWQYWFDAQARYFDLGSGINQYLVRPAVGYDINDNVSAWAGYAYFRSRSSSGDTVTENRYWQQLSWTAANWENSKLTMRARLEQRSISRGDDLGWVLRYQAKYVRPFASNPNLDLVIAIEPFVDLRDTDWGGDSGLAQNRTAVGVAWKVSPGLVIESGYMHQYIFRDSASDLVNHLGVVNFKVKF